MTAALAELIERVAGRRDDIEGWLAAEFAKQTVPFYCSVDLRSCEHKIAPVDANLFPSGFNNLSKDSQRNAVDAARRIIDRQWQGTAKVAIVVERHTRNPYYTDHALALRAVLEQAGYETKLALADGEPATLQGHHSTADAGLLERRQDVLRIDSFEPDLVILNNDLTSGTPEVLAGAAQPLAPPAAAGWAYRRKSSHFFQYERVVARFGREFGVDPWLLQAYFNVCNRVDISKRIGMGCLAQAIEETIDDICANYARIGCQDKPFVALKADAGTYGMGVVMVEDAEQGRNLNRRQRQNLSVIKDGVSVKDILIQEGVPTTDRIEGLVAEPVYYMVGERVVGGFWRLNEKPLQRGNLNTRGMLFWPMAGGNRPRGARAYTLEVVARLSLLATTRELAGEFAAGRDGK